MATPGEPGRRSKLTDEIEGIICDTLRAGATFECAAGRCGISVDAIHEWRRRGAGTDERPQTERYASFAKAVDQAMADAEMRLVGTINTATLESWQAAAWLLERRHPKSYGRQDRVEHSGEMTTRAYDMRKYTDEELAQLKAIELAKIAREADSKPDDTDDE